MLDISETNVSQKLVIRRAGGTVCGISNITLNVPEPLPDHFTVTWSQWRIIDLPFTREEVYYSIVWWMGDLAKYGWNGQLLRYNKLPPTNPNLPQMNLQLVSNMIGTKRYQTKTAMWSLVALYDAMGDRQRPLFEEVSFRTLNDTALLGFGKISRPRFCSSLSKPNSTNIGTPPSINSPDQTTLNQTLDSSSASSFPAQSPLDANSQNQLAGASNGRGLEIRVRDPIDARFYPVREVISAFINVLLFAGPLSASDPFASGIRYYNRGLDFELVFAPTPGSIGAITNGNLYEAVQLLMKHMYTHPGGRYWGESYGTIRWNGAIVGNCILKQGYTALPASPQALLPCGGTL